MIVSGQPVVPGGEYGVESMRAISGGTVLPNCDDCLIGITQHVLTHLLVGGWGWIGAETDAEKWASCGSAGGGAIAGAAMSVSSGNRELGVLAVFPEPGAGR